ncbi:hypothetical protein DY000_02033972 [Brassica cretica]|uniref:PGG domain-containing protein n=2 Tax=Brassica cretica TaxID=69181 RepID=A0ABQ7DZP9_BRACR|nr:hypothetical protein DY000_02033972 [Brassica cretica]
MAGKHGRKKPTQKKSENSTRAPENVAPVVEEHVEEQSDGNNSDDLSPDLCQPSEEIKGRKRKNPSSISGGVSTGTRARKAVSDGNEPVGEDVVHEESTRVREKTAVSLSLDSESEDMSAVSSKLLGHSTPPSQSNQTSSSPAYPTQQEQNTHSPRHSTLPGQNYLNPQFPMRGPPSPAHPPPPGWSSNQSPSVPSDDPTIVSLVGSTKPEELNPSMSVFQSAAHSLPPPSPSSIRISASRGPLPHEFHAMDRLSLCVLNYFFAGGPSYTSTWSQRPNLSTSIHIQCFLNQAAFSLFLLANAVFPRTRPVLAFVLDRLSFFLIVISAYLASMPMFPPYVAIIMLLVVAIVYIFARFRSNT